MFDWRGLEVLQGSGRVRAFKLDGWNEFESPGAKHSSGDYG